MMAKTESITLDESGGQGCKTVITKRENGSVYLTFKSTEGYGDPSFELDELKKIIKKSEKLKEE